VPIHRQRCRRALLFPGVVTCLFMGTCVVARPFIGTGIVACPFMGCFLFVDRWAM